MKNKKGFTLVEVLLVIVIMSIITLLVMPNISDILSTGKNKKYENIEEIVRNTLELYNIDNKEDLWESEFDKEISKTFDSDVITSTNSDINLDGCKINKLQITRKGTNSFKYDVCIVCSENNVVEYTSSFCNS